MLVSIDKATLQNWSLGIMAVAIAVVSLVVSHALVRDLKSEERTRMELWAEAMRSLSQADDNTDLGLVLRVINGNHTIPVIVLGADGEVQATRNVSDVQSRDEALLRGMAARWAEAGGVVALDMSDGTQMRVCYDESIMLRRLIRYPYIQLLVAAAFMAMCILALLAAKRAEQNKVWVGLSKETAHQLGTPISSLMAWTEVLRESYPEDEMIEEMGHDVSRLQMIAERFSKIGSAPELKPTDLNEVVQHVVTYIDRRTSRRVCITAELAAEPLMVRVNAPLFEWVVENLCKNAVDAMHGEGSLRITLLPADRGAASLEITDTGCGIPKNRFEAVFKPGFTTKQRGWGLGLSLARRIVQEYHGGRIYVKTSMIGQGTTFRIDLAK